MTPQTFHVLHVDDEGGFLKLKQAQMNRVASDITYEVTNEPTEALARLNSQNTPIEALVTDVDMPGMNGLELLKAVRELDERLPVVLYTGQEREEIATEAISNGVTAYIQKKHDKPQIQELANTLRDAINRTEA